MMVFVTDNKLNRLDCYHNFMIKQDTVGSYLIGFRLVAQLKSANGHFYTVAFIGKDSLEEVKIWADLNSITLNVE